MQQVTHKVTKTSFVCKKGNSVSSLNTSIMHHYSRNTSNPL
jgi:hypothetical protein